MTIWSQVSGQVSRTPRIRETKMGVQFVEFVLTHREQRFHLGQTSSYFDEVTISVFETNPLKVAELLHFGDRVMVDGKLRDRKLGYDRDVRINADRLEINPDIEI